MEGLSDRRFEVRFQCARALSNIRKLNPDLSFDQEVIFDVVLKELAIEKSVWKKLHPVEQDEPAGAVPQIDHVFRLLSLVLPAEPLRAAYHGLRTTDRQLSGTSLEYLETILPERIRQALWSAAAMPHHA